MRNTMQTNSIDAGRARTLHSFSKSPRPLPMDTATLGSTSAFSAANAAHCTQRGDKTAPRVTPPHNTRALHRTTHEHHTTRTNLFHRIVLVDAREHLVLAQFLGHLEATHGVHVRRHHGLQWQDNAQHEQLPRGSHSTTTHAAQKCHNAPNQTSR